MKTQFKMRIPVLAVMFACVLVATASAECGDLSKHKVGAFLQKQAWRDLGVGSPSLRLISNTTEPIVGLWMWKMISEGSEGIPNGTVVDQGFSQWHADGTELTVSGNRAPATGDVCLGAWKKTWAAHYQLSHYGISFDTSNNFVGLAHITQTLAVSSDGGSYSGKFTIDQFDTAGNMLAHIVGKIIGTKVTADSATVTTF